MKSKKYCLACFGLTEIKLLFLTLSQIIVFNAVGPWMYVFLYIL